METKLSLKNLKKAITQGKIPYISNCSWSSESNSFGDLLEIDMARKNRIKASSYSCDVWWTYTGNYPINLEGKIIEKGYETDKVEIDYS